ncbi:MAG: hypothetical protein M1812_000790 [Candelaria pacifica]|nr:MAG: hypothetical protein M1812_000790 [Candelaria pacifica]
MLSSHLCTATAVSLILGLLPRVLTSPVLFERDADLNTTLLLERVASPADHDATSDLQTFESDVNVKTGLNFVGCNDDQKKALQTAWHDVGHIASIVGDPNYIPLGSGTPERWYFGNDAPELAAGAATIKGNFQSALAIRSHWNVGDWWNNRHFDMRCDDPGNKYPSIGSKCSNTVAAYQINPNEKSLKNQYPTIVLCHRFFALDSLVERMKNTDVGIFPKDDVRSLTSQATTLLHECFHTERKDANSPGWSSPRLVDKSIAGFPGKAYGAARAKYLARTTLGGTRAAIGNVDNYVFYLVHQWMIARWGVVPYKPEFAWSAPRAEDAFGADATDIDASDSPIPKGDVKDDKAFFGTDEPIACVGEPNDRISTNQDYATKQMKDFCSYASDQKIKLTADKNYAAKGYDDGPGHGDGNTLWFGVSWREGASGSYTITEADCIKFLGRVLNGCNTNSLTHKYGGSAFSNHAVWDMTVVSGKDDKAPKGYPNV